MRVDFCGKTKLVLISTLPVGSCFTAERKQNKGTGVYMVVDKNSGLLDYNITPSHSLVAINLETGQLRKFEKNFEVIPCNVTATVE